MFQQVNGFIVSRPASFYGKPPFRVFSESDHGISNQILAHTCGLVPSGIIIRQLELLAG